MCLLGVVVESQKYEKLLIIERGFLIYNARGIFRGFAGVFWV